MTPALVQILSKYVQEERPSFMRPFLTACLAQRSPQSQHSTGTKGSPNQHYLFQSKLLIQETG